MLSCFDVANYFLSLVDEDCGDLMSNLKLQKLLYYAQGLWLSIKGQPLFNENLEAWAYGPVVPEVYHQYKHFGHQPLFCPKGIDFSIYSEEVTDFLGEVYSYYGQFSAWRLSELTHDETPWLNHYKKKNPIISHEEMKDFFKTQLK